MPGRRRARSPSSPRPAPLLLFLLFNLNINSFVFCDDQSVSVYEQCKLHGGKYSKENNRWDEYMINIREAAASHAPCSVTDECSTCHSSVIDSDLRPFVQGISKKLVEEASHEGARLTKYQVIQGKVFRSQECMFPTRCEGIEHFLLKVAPFLDDTEFILNTRDWPQINTWTAKESVLPVFSFSKVSGQHNDIMYPAWAFWSGGPAISLHPRGLGRWDLKREELGAAAESYPWSKKADAAFFRGSRTSKERDPIVRLSRSCPAVVDAQYTKNQAWKSDADTLGQPPVKEVSLPDHCQHKFLFNYRGVAASFRLKHLFLCGSTVLHVGQEWLEFWYPSLTPWYHYIPVPSHASETELLGLLEFLFEHEDLASEIAENGRDFVRNHLRMEDVVCYWRELLTKYTKLLDYKVERDLNCVVQISK